MVKVTGLDLLAEIVEEDNRIRKAEREIRKARIREMVAEGVDPEIAKVMVDSFIKAGL